jgi:two-component system, cell cycle response regulator
MGPISGNRTAIALPSERPKAAGKPVLVVISGPELGRKFDLASGEMDIGRDEEATFRIDSDLISRRHAAIQKFAGRFIVADMGSTNGTFVNDQRVKTHTLVDGDQIRVGKVVLKYTESDVEAQYHEQILQMAHVDALTGAYNKRYAEDALRRSVADARSRGGAFSMVLFDIDHFKKINDTWGHAAGDAVLKEIAEVVRGQLRESDVLCRVGGEEFAILLAGTSVASARGAAEFIRGAVEMTDFMFEGKRIPVTVSLGVAVLEPSDESSEALFKRVDGLLYESKRTGRNKVSG